LRDVLIAADDLEALDAYQATLEARLKITLARPGTSPRLPNPWRQPDRLFHDAD
jgi:hypothetical protein